MGKIKFISIYFKKLVKGELTMTKKINARVLKKIIEEILFKNGLSEEDSRITSEVLINANLYGVDSHGISLIETYVNRIKEGGINSSPNRNVIKDSGCITIIDADGGMGPVSATLATQNAIKKAEGHGVGVVMVNNSNHIGMLAHYVNEITKNEMIGIVLTNSGPNVAAWGGAEAVLGNNALAVGIPVQNEAAFLLDMASGIVACGKVRMAADKGIEKIPNDWILDKNGEKTDSPLDFLNGGVVLPFGQHKGYGIGMLIDFFTGVLSGGKFATQVQRQRSDYSKISESSHTFIAINPELFIEKEELNKRVEEWLTIIKGSKKAFNVEEILIPGETEKNKFTTNVREGIEITEKQLNVLKSLAEDYVFDLI